MSKKRRQATISVTGRATAFARPDEARCALALSAVHPTGALAIDDVAARAETLSGLLDTLGIDPADRFTSAVVVAEHSEYRDGVPVYLGQRAAVQVEVRLRDPARVAPVLRGAVDAAGASVEPPRDASAYDTRTSAFEAYRRAAQDASRRAQAYAEGLGTTAGAVLAVSEPGAEISARFASKALAGDTAGLPVELGEMEVTATVAVTFALEAL